MTRALGRVCTRHPKHNVAYANYQYALRRTCRVPAQSSPPSKVRQRQSRVPWLATQTFTRHGSSTPLLLPVRAHSVQSCTRHPIISLRWTSSKAHPGEHQQNIPEPNTTERSNHHVNKPSAFIPSKRALSRSVLITGGTSGIGFQIAKRTLQEGASHVRIITRDAERGASAIDRLRHETATEARLDYIRAEVDEYSDPKLVRAVSSATPQRKSSSTCTGKNRIQKT